MDHPLPDLKLQLRRQRVRHRTLAHHVPLLIASGLSTVALYYTRTYSDVLSRASFATAYPALILLAGTLLIGPWNVIRKKGNPTSNDLRRDLGIWAGALGILHTAVGQNVHLRGRPWLYYVYERKSHHTIPARHDLFGLANYTGAASVLLLIALLATSNDYSLRTLGPSRWKQLQRCNYVVFGMAAVHAVAYQTSEKQNFRFVTTLVVCIGLTVAVQTAGIVRRRFNASGSNRSRTQA